MPPDSAPSNDVANNVAIDLPDLPDLLEGYRPEFWPKRQLRRQLRDLQTHLPILRDLKFDFYNAATRHLGLFADPEFRLLARIAPIGLAIDVGGNWGQSVAALQKFARPRRIVTIEPIPSLATRLRRIFAHDATVEVLELALGETAGLATIHVPRYRNYIYDGIASIDRDFAESWLNSYRMARYNPARLTVDSIAVQIERLDALALKPDLIKIDVQGLEPQVVFGGLETIAAHRPMILVERPEESLVLVLARFGLLPFGWDGKRLCAGDLSRTNCLFLSPRHDPRHAALLG